MNILGQNVVKIAFQRTKDFYKIVLLVLGALALFRGMIIFTITSITSSASIEFVADDASLGWVLLLIWFIISFAIGFLFASEFPKFIRRGISRIDYFFGSFLALLLTSFLAFLLIRGLNLILTTLLSNLVLSANPVNLEVSFVKMLFIYLLSGMVSYLMGFLVTMGWKKLGFDWRIATFFFSGWMIATALGVFQNGILDFVWLGFFVMGLAYGETPMLITAMILIPILVIINYLLAKSSQVKVT